VEAISATIRKHNYFYFVSRFCSRAFSVVGNIFLDRGADEHRRHLMVFTGGPFWAEGLFFQFAGLVLPFPCRPNQLPAAWGGSGAIFGEKYRIHDFHEIDKNVSRSTRSIYYFSISIGVSGVGQVGNP